MNVDTNRVFEVPGVWLAPMSGATDAPFRRQAIRFGAPAVVSEMVAGETLLTERSDTVRRMCRHEGDAPWIVQLAARRPEDMLGGARLLSDAGVDVVDINMGCPSRKVTGGQSGSALMRDMDLATRIIEAALEGAGGLPVTLKMRLGWDERNLNAPELGALAERLGCAMLTVHGRTRCQFYKGKADWSAIRETVDAVDIPVIANGDIGCKESADEALRLSGAHGVMVGRMAMGAPWLPGLIAGSLDAVPDIEAQCESLCEQIADSAKLYGNALGVRIVRKHVSASIDLLSIRIEDEARRALRSELCQVSAPDELIAAIRKTYSDADMVEIA